MPAQPVILEALASGNNLLVMGPSGSGKSTGLLIGLVDGLLKSRARGPSVLYLTSSKETTAWITSLCKDCGLVAARASEISDGGGPKDDPPDVLFHPPGRLESISTQVYDWAGLRAVVLDDGPAVVAGLGGAHLSVLLERLFSKAHADPQRLALTTTFGEPQAALPWLCGGSSRASRVLRTPGAGGRRLLEVELVSDGMDPVEVAAVKVRGRNSLIALDSRQAVTALGLGLERRGLRCQGEDRNCELSLGVPKGRNGFEQIVSFLPPGSVSELLSTLALTDRDPRSISRLCLATQSEEEFLVACAVVSLAGQRWVEPLALDPEAWPVYVQQLISRILDSHGVTLEDALSNAGRPWAFQSLSLQERQDVLNHLLETDVLCRVGEYLVLGAAGERAFDRAQGRQTGTAFWRPERYTLKSDDGAISGSLDAWFFQALPDFTFAQAGQSWQITALSHRSGVATLRRIGASSGVSWLGPLRCYHPKLCTRIRDLLSTDTELPFLERRQQRTLRRLRERWRNTGKESGRLLTFAGAKVNALVARLHHQLSGEHVDLSNLMLEVKGSGVALRQTLERLQAGLSVEELAGLVTGCDGPFLALLPPTLKNRYLLGQLFDLGGARALAQTTLDTYSDERPPAGVRRADADYVTDSGIGDPFFRQLAFLARTRATQNKWVFLPEASLKWILSERLLHAGVDWVNFRFQTPFQMALDLAAPHLLHEGIHPKPEGLGPELIARLLLQLPQDGKGYFRPLAEQGGLARPLWKSIQELRMAGLTSDDLTIEMFTSPAKGVELKALLASYEGYLAEHRLGDRATVFLAALQRCGEAPVVPEDLVLEYPSWPWSALERRFLDALGGNVIPARVTERTEPRRWALLCPRRETKPQVISRDIHLLSLLSSTPAPAAKHDGTLRFFCAGRRDAEIQEVLRRLLERAIPLDQVELVVHDPDSLALIWDKLQKHGLVATFAEGLPVCATTPGRALLGLLQWSEANFASFYFRELLLAGLLRGEGLSSATGARYLERSRATWGRATYALHLGQLEARYRAAFEEKDVEPDRAESRSAQADGVSRFSSWVGRLLARWPSAHPDGTLSLAGLLDGLLSTLEDDVPHHNNLDRTAHVSIARSLRDLRLLADHSWSERQCYRLVREKLQGLTVGAGRPEPGKLYVTSPLKMGRAGRSHLFLLGLEAGSLLPGTAEDPVLSDQERQRIHESLELSRDRVDESRYQLGQRLGGLDGEVTLSYSCRDYRSGEELLPSRLFFDAARLLYPEVSDYDQLAEALGEPLSLAPQKAELAAGDSEWWLARLVGCGQECQPTVLSGFPWLSRGNRAQGERKSPLFTAFDGWVPQAANLFDPRTTGIPTSVSQLQDLAGCAYLTFLRNVLQLRPVELERPDPDRWLGPAERGTALHETFAAYYRKLRTLGQRPSLTDLDVLSSFLEIELTKIREILPTPSSAVESAEREQLYRDLLQFLKLETDEEREVIACEVGFGMADTFGEPLATVDPVVIDLGDGLRFPLRGRIDRIDWIEGAYEVVDYKTGSQLTDAPRPHYVRGQLLQHALYALVAERLLAGQNGEVRGSSYYFPVARARKPRVSFPYPDKSALASVLNMVMDPLKTGAFAHTTQSEKHCRYCDFRAACVAQSDQGMLAKQDHEKNLMLDSRRRLRDIR